MKVLYLVKTTVRELGLVSPQMSIQVSNYIKIGISIVKAGRKLFEIV